MHNDLCLPPDTNGDKILDPMELEALFYNEVCPLCVYNICTCVCNIYIHDKQSKANTLYIHPGQLSLFQREKTALGGI